MFVVGKGMLWDVLHFGQYREAKFYPQTNTSDSRLSEWWCIPNDSESLEFSPSAALEVADDELQLWLNRYSHFIARGLKTYLVIRTMLSNFVPRRLRLWSGLSLSLF